MGRKTGSEVTESRYLVKIGTEHQLSKSPRNSSAKGKPSSMMRSERVKLEPVDGLVRRRNKLGWYRVLYAPAKAGAFLFSLLSITNIIRGGITMSNTLLVRAKNEETLLPRVLRVLAQQGLGVKDLHMSTSKDAKELEIRITLFNVCAAQAVKLLSKQVSIMAVTMGYQVQKKAI